MQDFEQGQDALKAEIEAEERFLADQDRADVLRSKHELIQARRQSLAYRNQSEFQDRVRVEGEKTFAKLVEAEDRSLALEAWQDVKKAQEAQREAARKSLSARIIAAKQEHQLDLEAHRAGLDRLHSDLEEKRLEWLDKRSAKEEEKERSRRSILVRLDSWREQRVAEAKLESAKQALADEEARIREQEREDLAEAKRRMQEEALLDKATGRMFV